ncbi:MAG: molybdopterin-binding/glycosyltransferase family 2 protein [Pseudomonadota bacterium]
MKFGPLPLNEAEGAVLAHSLSVPGGRLKKGRHLTASDLARLAEAGIAEVVAARLEPGDVPEDTAAARIAAALAPDPAALGLTVSAPFTGRTNLFAQEAGVMTLDANAVAALNALDEAVTLATLPPFARVVPRQMVATVKIIPYVAPDAAVAAAERLAARSPVVQVHALARRSAGLLLTQVPGQKDSVVEKGAEAVRRRLAGLGIALAAERIAPHRTEAIADAIASMPGEMVLILTGSATSDRADAAPAGLIAAGGRLTRFGMPVDPGNLLFLGALGDRRPVIGLPGCARSPKLNGADWVLERIACGIDVTSGEIAAMGVGGLLKEIPSRPVPRAGPAEMVARRPLVHAVLLAAGASRRMRGRDKLLEEVEGQPLLSRTAAEIAASGVDSTVAVLRPGDAPRAAALSGTGVRTVENPRAAEGMGTSLAAGLRALPADTDAALVVMADMPEISAADIDRLIAAFDPAEGREIIRATTATGRPGHPVLFSRRFFEALQALEGDRGARTILEENAEFVTDVPLAGEAATTDLDTPEAWAAWRARQGVAAPDELQGDRDRAMMDP